MPSALQLLWLVPALPLAGFLANGVLALRRPRAKHAVSIIGVGVLLAALALAIVIVLAFLREGTPGPLVFPYWEWMPVGDLHVTVALQLDQLSAVMLLVVTGVSSLIHVFSVGYMGEDPGYARYFAYLNLFVFFMLVLVLGASFPVMFVGWEGVGLCSYLLIGFWFNEQINADAGKKAFLVNRIGDVGFLVAMLMIFAHTGSLDFRPVFAQAPKLFTPGGGAITAITLFLFLGCTGKSAQIPLYTWLPDAMQGPTPVSALIHAATMVTAGVYLVARCNVLYALAPVASAVVAGIGALTAFFAATIALKQWDIKRVLAYSTVSQLGYMFLGVGSGAYAAGIFHLVTHAFFKALLFLGTSGTGERESAPLNEGPWVMTGPLVVLGALSVAGGALNVPALFRGHAWLEPWLEPVTAVATRLRPAIDVPLGTEWTLVIAAVAVAPLGIFAALRLLRPQGLVPARLAPAARGFPRLLWKKWDVDEIYDFLLVRPLVWLSREVLWKTIDLGLIDGAGVNGAARLSQVLGWVGSRLQTGQLGFYVVLFVGGVLAVLWTAVR